MKNKLDELESTEVTGGNVILSGPLNVCGFNTIRESYKIKGDIKVMRNELLRLYDANEGMNEREFDILVRDHFLANGWI